MITEAIFSVLFAVFDALDALVPDVPWPSWFSAPLDWAASASQSVDIDGVTAWIHPAVVDVAGLAILLRLVKIFVDRLRSLVSLVTGGGGESSV